MRRGPVAVVLSLAFGCSSAEIQGGRLVAPGTAPSGKAVAEYRMKDCKDAAGAPVALEEALVHVFAKGDSFTLRESRPRVDTLEVDASSASDQELTFAAALNAEDGAPVLREYRVPRGAAGPGRFALARHFSAEETPGGLRESHGEPALTCALLPIPDSSPLVPPSAGSIVPPP